MNKNKAVTKCVKKNIHVCDVCEKGFGYKCSLKTHMLVHTGTKDFQCHGCLKRFARKHHLTRHMVTHTKENFSSVILVTKFLL